VNRRQALRLAAIPAAALLLSGHTPYGQWVVYRQKHLLIGCHKADPETYDLAKQVVALLAEHLPAANTRVARASDAGRLASLLGTGQMNVATLSASDAAEMLRGAGRFEAYGAIALRLLTPIDGRLLVARSDFPERHAWLVTGALVGSGLTLAVEQPRDAGIPWHPGSRSFLDGRPEPGDD
jgi:hypothetical protein